MAPDHIVLTRTEGLEIFVALDDAHRHLADTDHLTVLVQLLEAELILLGHLYGGLS